MKPGYLTTEFWLTLLSQLLTLLVIAGWLPVSDKDHLEKAFADAATALVALIASATTVWQYIQSRTNLKRQSVTADAASAGLAFPAERLPFAALVAAALLSGAAPAHAAAPPNVERSCIFFGSHNGRTDPALTEALRQIADNQRTIIQLLQHPPQPPVAAPAPAPQIIVMPQIPLGGPPYQQIPLGAAPQQQIPLGGQPHQQIPLGGQPIPQIPLGGPAPQQIPLGVAPRQPFEAPTPPRQTLPFDGRPVAPLGPGAADFQSYRAASQRGATPRLFR